MDGEGQPYITLGFIKAMLEEFREQRLIHKRYAFQVPGMWHAAYIVAFPAGGRGLSAPTIRLDF